MPRRLAPILALAALAAPADAPAATGADRAVSWAMQQVGHREVGKTNCSALINRWEREMGLRIPPCRPWCGAFVHQAILRGGVKLSARLIDPERTAQDAAAGRRGLHKIALGQVRKGDILLFAFSRELGVPSHMAIVRSRPAGGRVSTVEGNVGHTAVATSRKLRIAVMAVRVDRL